MILVLILLVLGHLAAQEPEALKAAQFFEAKEYTKAIDLYEVLLKQPLTPWQKSAVLYNLGTVLLEQNDYAAAIETWRSIPLGEDPYPLLTRRIDTNLAVAYYRQAEQLSPSDFERARFLLLQALAHAKRAQQEECAWQKLTGASSCLPESDLEELQAAIKVRLAKGAEVQITPSTPSQRLFLLLGSLKRLKQRLIFLQSQTAPKQQLAPYLDLFRRDASRWLPLWSSSEKEVERLNKKLLDTFLQAEQAYEKSLRHLIEGEFSKSLQEVDSSFSLLSSLASQVGSAEPIAATLRRLLAAYQLALLEEPLQEVTLAELLDDQKRSLEPFFSTQELTQLSTQDLALSLKALQQREPLKSRFYFEEARYQLTKILQPVKRGTTATPIEILQQAVDQLHHAIVLKRGLERMGARQSSDQGMSQRVDTAQQAAAATAQPFLDQVYALQTHEFHLEGTLEERCQAHPWDEVLPIFEEGYRLTLQNNSSLTIQEEALQHWKKAIDLLQKPKTAFKGSCSGSSPQASSEQKTEKTTTVPMNQVLQNIQEIEKEERSAQLLPTAVPKGERPW